MRRAVRIGTVLLESALRYPDQLCGAAEKWDKIDINEDGGKKDCKISYQQKGRTMVVVSIFRALESLEVEVKMGRLIKGK